MFKNLLSLAIALFVVCGLSVISYSGNQNNAGNTGVVVAVITCDVEGSPGVEQSQISIDSSVCTCTGNGVDGGNIDCDEIGDDCTGCLSSLQRLGLTITHATGYFDVDAMEEEIQYLLSGNSGPFLERQGCFCDL